MRRFTVPVMIALWGGLGEFHAEALIFADQTSSQQAQTTTSSAPVPIEGAPKASQLPDVLPSDVNQFDIRKLQDEMQLLRRDVGRLIELLDTHFSRPDVHTDSILSPNTRTPERNQGNQPAAERGASELQSVLRLEIRRSDATEVRVGQSIRFVISATNTTDDTVSNVRITFSPDENLKPDQGSLGLEKVPNTNAILWKGGTLGPKQSLTREIVCICRTPAQIVLTRVEAIADRDVRQATTARLTIVDK